MVLTFSARLKYSHIGIADPQHNDTNVVNIKTFPIMFKYLFFIFNHF